MRKLILLAAACCCAAGTQAQNQLDNYFDGNTRFIEVGNQSHGLSAPHDLDYVPGRWNEWWVLNRETNGGSVVIYYGAGLSGQTQQFRRDSHNSHFMARAVAIAFGDNHYFVTAQDIKNTASASSTFMGPALWSSDTAIFARQHQNDWEPGELLGSHIDMLHQSPYGMGVAHDHDNVYWYFDGYNGNICKYDFATPHGVGEDDHSDGIIHRYTDVTVKRKAGMPSHMALDKANNWLYIIDGGNNRIIRMKTNSGTVGADLTVPASGGEPLAEYKEVTGATVEVLPISNLTTPCGIDYRNNRLIISDNATGNIHIYKTDDASMPQAGVLITGAPGVMGVRVDNDNKIWYVNKNTKQFMHAYNGAVLSVPSVANEIKYNIYPNPATSVLNVSLHDLSNGGAAKIVVVDIAGKVIYATTTSSVQNTINTSAWAKGMYMVGINHNGTTVTEKVIVQ